MVFLYYYGLTIVRCTLQWYITMVFLYYYGLTIVRCTLLWYFTMVFVHYYGNNMVKTNLLWYYHGFTVVFFHRGNKNNTSIPLMLLYIFNLQSDFKAVKSFHT